MDERGPEDYRAFLAARRQELTERLEQAARRSGRSACDIEFLAVSKTVGVDEVVSAFEAGYRVFGENRPQELKRKVDGIAQTPAQGVRFDMIGNLQKNKINQVLKTASLIHSVSSAHLAEAIASRAQAQGLHARCLLEVNVSGERSKGGFTPDELRFSVDAIRGLDALEVRGLMTMAPAGDLDAARRAFCGLRELRDELRERMGLGLDTLSCGMSGDFEVAVEEGSTLIRLGRIVFDPAYAG